VGNDAVKELVSETVQLRLARQMKRNKR
jgi:hypothetical protein